MQRPARFFERISDEFLQCNLCPASCRLKENQVGVCGSRLNKEGGLVTENYGELVTVAIDPIEKKPLYHFYPGAKILSTGTYGCNLGCLNCQNWQISQERQPTSYASPERLLELALEHDSLGVAFTYTEPTIWAEYILDAAPLLRAENLKVVLVTNGYIGREPLEEMIEVVDAMNIDLKSIRPEFYRRICKGRIEPVLDTIHRVAESSVHLEVTNLIIPGENDTDEDIESLVDFIADLSPDIPLHFSAFHPDYKLFAERTPVETMLRARGVAQSKLNYIYLGNVHMECGSDTICPGCGQILIDRAGYSARITGLTGNICSGCGLKTNIIC